MKTDFWLTQIPLWGSFLFTAVTVLFSIGIGTLFGRHMSRSPEHEAEVPLGTIIGASLGLVAFMLAFTFGITAQVFQTKRQLLLDEVNAIGTSYLRAELLTEPHSSDVRKLLREYVDLRVNLAKEDLYHKPEKLQEAVSYSELLQDRMWSHAVAIAKADRSSLIDALFISSLNNVIDLQNSRLTVFHYRIPHIIWFALYFITILSMVMVGYQIGLSGKSSIKVGIVLALTFSTVVSLIADLDRTTEGYFKLNQQPIFELQKKMQAQTQETGYEQRFLDSKGTSDKELESSLFLYRT